MVKAERVILQCFSLILIIKNAYPKNSLGIITNYYEKLHHSPLIVLINTASNYKSPLRSYDSENPVSIDGNAYFRATNDNNNPNAKETKEIFERALRSRCEKYLECEVKCEKPKKKDECKMNCQQIFDALNVCNTNNQQKWPQKSNKEVYEYLKKNPPHATQKPQKDSCEPDDCDESSNSCEESNEC